MVDVAEEDEGFPTGRCNLRASDQGEGTVHQPLPGVGTSPGPSATLTPNRLPVLTNLFNLSRMAEGGRSQHPFECRLCYGLLRDPVTVACGHTYCRGCLDRESKTCKKCGEPVEFSQLTSNVLVTQITAKLFPDHCQAERLRAEGNHLFQLNDFEKALEVYTRALEQVPSDHLILSNRSLTYASLGQYTAALKDADSVTELQPYWVKGYYWKGVALFELGSYEESVKALLQCLVFDSSSTTVQIYLVKVLHKIFTDSMSGDVKETGHNFQLSPITQMLTRGESTAESIQTILKVVDEQFQQPACEGCQDVIETKTLGENILIPEKSDPKSSQTALANWKNTRNNQNENEANLLTTESKNLLQMDDFTCSLCLRLLYKPVTTPCGHTFCCHCLNRCLDFRAECPFCKNSLAVFLRKLALKIIKEAASSVSWPGQPATYDPIIPHRLHVFEPKYRLMMRQCLESGTKQFGMCVSVNDDNKQNFADYGCLLEILDVQYFPDGRSLVDTVGGRRFKVLSRGRRDGYNIAKVEILKDAVIMDSEEMKEIKALQLETYWVSETWLGSLPAEHKQRIHQHYGTLPPSDAEAATLHNGPSWLWWVITILPIDTQIQVAALSITSLKERFRLVLKVLKYLKKKDL